MTITERITDLKLDKRALLDEVLYDALTELRRELNNEHEHYEVVYRLEGRGPLKDRLDLIEELLGH